MITIIDYGLGNLASIQNMLKKIGSESIITSDINKIATAEKIILPGVGAYDDGIKNIETLGLKEVLNQKANQEKIPILGICLGMQLMTKGSEEGNVKGLGWIDADTIKFKFDDNKLKIPHMGWNRITPKLTSPIFENFDQFEEPRFYHVHSYFVRLNNPSDEISSTHHGLTFTSAFQHDNIFGVQFHPEKSHKFGMKLLDNFVKL